MSKNPGLDVTTKTGKRGRTFNSKGLISGKVPVYIYTSTRIHKMQGLPDVVIGIEHDTEAVLCAPETLTINGYID